MSELDGRVVLISGASGGIGSECVELALQAGAIVAGLDRKAAAKPEHERFLGLQVDLSDEYAVPAAIESVLARFGGLDVVVAAHGGSGRRFGDGPMDACSARGWDATLDMNLRSTFLLYHHALPALIDGGGTIVTVASVLGMVGGDEDFATHAYAAAKGAAIAMTRAMAVTYAARGVRCNVVAPGLIRTPMSERAQADPRIGARLQQLQPLGGTFGSTRDVAEAALYLASERSRFITGVVLPVDGGWTAR